MTELYRIGAEHMSQMDQRGDQTEEAGRGAGGNETDA